MGRNLTKVFFDVHEIQEPQSIPRSIVFGFANGMAPPEANILTINCMAQRTAMALKSLRCCWTHSWR